MKETKAVIFDMDGVLVDSQPLHFEADRLVLENCGVSGFDPEIVQKYAGVSVADKWAGYKKDLLIQTDVKKLVEMYSEISEGLIDTSDLMASKFAADVLKSFKERGISRSVASSSSPSFIRRMLEKIGLGGSEFFDFIISGENMERGKPAPDIFLAAVERHGISAEECVVVEDSSNGVKAAVAAGIRCVGYINASSGEQDLSLADFTIENFRELIL